MSIWYNLEIIPPRLESGKDRREMAKFVAALIEKFRDIYTYGLGSSSKIEDADGDTVVDTEESTDEDKIRFKTDSVPVGLLDYNNPTTTYFKVNFHKDNDGDTGFQVEESADDDILRLDSNSVEIAAADENQFAVASGKKLGLEGYAGDTYWKYNSSTEYMEGYINGNKRVDL